MPRLDRTASLATRLDTLEAHDPESAAFLRQAVLTAMSRPQVRSTCPSTESLPTWLQEGSDAEAPDIVVLLGADDTVARLDACLPPTSRFLLLETDPVRAADLFQKWPLEERVASGRLTLALGMNRKRVSRQFAKLFRLTASPSVRLIFAADLEPVAEAFYLSAMREIREGIHLNVFNINTMILRGAQWQFNTLQNLPSLLANPGIQALEGLFQGRPGLVVGAGPSLNAVIPHLREAAAGFVVIATGTALRPLRAAGIRPDLVVSVDASIKTGPQFATVCDDLFLACSSFAHPPILSLFRGLFVAQLPANPIDRWLNVLGMGRGYLVAAGTVTTTAIDLARRMGCRSITTIGFDLSFADDGTTHASQSMYDGCRLDPASLIRVPGNYQAEVLTTEQFRCYLALIEDYLASHPDTIYLNATNAGARIAGMRLMRPEEIPALADPAFDAYGVIADAHAAFRGHDTERILPELEKVSRQLQDISESAHLGAMICNQLILMLRSPCAGDEDLAREHLEALSAIDRKFRDAGESSAVLEMSLWPASYRTTAAPPAVGDPRTNAIASNRRSRELYEQIAGAAKWTRRLVDGAHDAIKAGRRHSWTDNHSAPDTLSPAVKELVPA